MVLELIGKNTEAYGVIDILEPESINSCNRTTFTYAQKPLGICLAIDKKYFKQAMANDSIGAIITPPSAVISEERYKKTIVIAEHSADLYYFIHNHYGDALSKLADDEFISRIDKSASIDETAVIGEKVCIGKNVKISAGCIVRNHSIIGDGTVLQPGVIVGADGVFAKSILGVKSYIKHHGGVNIGTDCVLHASSIIVRSVNFSEYTKIDDGVHIGIRSSIGHDCRIGENCDISSGVTISGRVQMDRLCWIGAGAIISNALRIGESAKVRIGAVVVSDIKPNGDVSGNFAVPHSNNIKDFINRRTN